MTDNALKEQAFKLKGRLYTLTVLQLTSIDLRLIEQQLRDLAKLAPKWFESTPVVLDCTLLKDAHLDVGRLCALMRDFGLLPLAMQSLSLAMQSKAKEYGLTLLSASNTQDKSLIIEKESIPVVSAATKLITTPIRSGQQVVSKGADLLIVSSVSHGSELLSDGNIHVYGALRGRALAGISGDKNARIFCHELDAELVSIAGIYCLSDAMKSVKGPCQIFLHDDRIQIEAL